MDLTRAFDTISHDILLKKLSFYGFRGKSHDWIENYLSVRRQCVFYDGSASNIVPSKIGVPQGSILRPLLVLLYINDLPNVSSFVTFILYADDTNLFCQGNSLEDISSLLNSELQLINS